MTTPDRTHRPDCADPTLLPWTGTRGDALLRCRGCGRVRPADPEAATPTPPPPVALVPVVPAPRFWLGCAGCGTDMWCLDARPRIPLCGACKQRGKPKYAPPGSRQAHTP